MRVVFFVAGNYAHKIWKQILEEGICIDYILVFADNNPALWGTFFYGKPVINPFEISEYKVDLVVITSIYQEAIRRQLVEQIKISSEQICSFEEYKRICHVKNIYKKKYNKFNSEKKCSVFNTNNIVIYTAITGDYDNIKEPAFLADNLTYVCITNNPKIKSKNWIVEYIKNDYRDNVHLARHIKMNPQYFFHDFDVSVWVDGKYQILDDIRKYILLYERKSEILCFPHPDRECICDEAAACVMLRKGNKRDMILQVSDYLKKGYPLDYGLYETGCMVRIHNNDEVKMLMKKWENEIQKYSIRDQLSFPYVCWKNNFYPDISDLDINRNPWLLYNEHLI